eukprot:403375721
MRTSFSNLRSKRGLNQSIENSKSSNLTARMSYLNTSQLQYSHRDVNNLRNSANISSRSRELGSTSRENQGMIEAKRILDSHINYFSKDTYYKIKEGLMNFETNQSIIQIFRDYQAHQDSDLLAQQCLRYYNQEEYQKLFRPQNPSERSHKKSTSQVPYTGREELSQYNSNSSLRKQNDQQLNLAYHSFNASRREDDVAQYYSKESQASIDRLKDQQRMTRDLQYSREMKGSPLRNEVIGKLYQRTHSESNDEDLNTIEKRRQQLPFQRLEKPISKIINRVQADQNNLYSQLQSKYVNDQQQVVSQIRLKEIAETLGLTQRTFTSQDIENLISQVLPYCWYASINEFAFNEIMQRTFNNEITYAQIHSSVAEQVILDLFNIFDQNQDGLIDKDEMSSGLRLLLSSVQSAKRGVSPKQNQNTEASHYDARSLFNQIDSDQNRQIYLQEMREFLEREIQHKMTLNLSREIFRLCNSSGSGVITFLELQAWMTKDGGRHFKILTDLIEGDPLYIDKYHEIIFKGIKASLFQNAFKFSPGKPDSLFNNEKSPSVQNFENIEQTERLRVSQFEKSNSRDKNSQGNSLEKNKTIIQSRTIRNQNKAALNDSFESEKNEQVEKFDNITVKRVRPPTKEQRQADCNNKSTILQQKQQDIIQKSSQNQQKQQMDQSRNYGQEEPAPCYDDIFESKEFQSVEEKIKQLSSDSGLRRINALEFSRQIKMQLEMLEEDGEGLTFEDFKAMLEPQLKRVAKNQYEKKGFETTLKQIFDMFDENHNGTVEQIEMSNCMSLMCGGSVQDKIHAAFILFDLNSSNTLNLEELTQFMGTVFKVLDQLIPNKRGSILNNLNIQEMTEQTANKCFMDLNLELSQEVQFEAFMEWLLKKPDNSAQSLSLQQIKSGKQSNLISQNQDQKDSIIEEIKPKALTEDQKEIQAIIANQPTKNELRERLIKSTQNYIDTFLDQNKYLETINALRGTSQLGNVRIQDAVQAFQKEIGVSCQQVNKQQFFEIMRGLLANSASNSNINQDNDKNQNTKLEETLRKLYSLFDQDKNGILDLVEIFSSLSILCKGTIHAKINSIQSAFFGGKSQSKNTSDGTREIRFKDLKKYFQCVFKISLETQNEIIFDYDLEKLAEQTAKDCFSYNLEEDLVEGSIPIEGIFRWTNKKGGKIY